MLAAHGGGRGPLAENGKARRVYHEKGYKSLRELPEAVSAGSAGAAAAAVLRGGAVCGRQQRGSEAAVSIEEGTVKSRISRARKGLRRLMAATCPDFGEAARPGDYLELRPEAAGCAQKTA